MWQTRKGRPGWYEVDEGLIRIPKGEGKGASKNEAQRRECYKCGDLFHWRSTKVRWNIVFTSEAARRHAGTMAERDDIRCGRQYTRKWHTCLACWASELGIPENEARKRLIEKRSHKSAERPLAYQHAKSHIQSTFELLGYQLEGEDLSQAEETCRLGDSLDGFECAIADPTAASSLREAAPAGFASATTEKPRMADPHSNRSKKKKAMHRLAVAERTVSRWHSPDAIMDLRTEKTYRLGASDLSDMRWGFRFDSADGIANSTRATSSLREVEPVGCPGDDAKRKRGARGGTKTSKRATKNSFWRLRITSSQSSSSCAAPLVPQPPREAPPQHMLVRPHVVPPRFLRPRPPRGPPPAHLLRPGAEPCLPRFPDITPFPYASRQSWRYK